jgi:hypothetical protein
MPLTELPFVTVASIRGPASNGIIPHFKTCRHIGFLPRGRVRLGSQEAAGGTAAHEPLTLKERSPNMRKTLFCGVDLHSNNAMYVIADRRDKQLLAKRLPNQLSPLSTNAPLLSLNTYLHENYPCQDGQQICDNHNPPEESE